MTAKGGPAGLVHPALDLELLGPADVDRAPLALRLARSKAGAEAGLINRPAHSIDPAEAECLVEGSQTRKASEEANDFSFMTSKTPGWPPLRF